MLLAAAAAAAPGSAEAPAASLQRDSVLQPLEQSPPGLLAVPAGSIFFFGGGGQGRLHRDFHLLSRSLLGSVETQRSPLRTAHLQPQTL